MRVFSILYLVLILLQSNSQPYTNIVLREEIQVSTDSIGGKLKCEPSVVMHENVVIVSWNDSYGGQTGTGYGVCIAWSISYDSGKTFEFGGFLSEGKNGTLGGADSWLAKDSKGNFYLQVLSFKEAVHLYKMAHDNLGNWIKLKDPVASETADKPFLHISDNDVFWISYSDNQGIFITSSKDLGHTWSTPIHVSKTAKKSRGGSSITTYKNMVLVAWGEGGTTNNELWYSIVNEGNPGLAQLLFEQTDLKNILTSGYSMGFDHEGTSGNVTTPNFTWLNSSKNDTFPVNLTFGIKEDDKNSILFFEYNQNRSCWRNAGKVGEVPTSFSRIFASNANIDSYPSVLYYDRRNCQNKECTLTDVYLSIFIGGNWKDYRISTVSSDWNSVSGDKKYAPIQRNFGDYITLASDKNKLIAVWTDGRNGSSQIYCRIIELL